MDKRKRAAVAEKGRLSIWLRQHRHALIEHGKTLLIVVLFCSACFLADRSGILGQGGFSAVRESVASLIDRHEAGPAVSNGQEYAAAARPQVMAVSPESAARRGAAFTGDVDELYERFSAYLGEALGTAGTPEPILRDEWEQVLCEKGIYFDFITEQRLSCLAAWQGTALSDDVGDAGVRRLFLSVRENVVFLYYDTGSGCYRCATALDQSAVDSRMAVYQSNGAYFAFEREETAQLAPDVLIVPSADTVRTVSVTSAAPAGTVETVLQQFGMNAITATSYQEASGTTVYLDGYSTLRIREDGLIAYEREPGQDLPEFDLHGAASLPELADQLYSLTLTFAGGESDCGELRLLRAEYDLPNDRYTVSFAYFIDGMQVCSALGPAAEFILTDGLLTQAQLWLRQYQFTGETQTPLPAVQAAALVSASGGKDPVRVYQDMGDRVAVSWKMG